MDFIQGQIGYDFTHDEYLKSAFVAAHRSEKDGVADDGNRGMARIGQIAIEMAETSYAVVVEKARLSKCSSKQASEYIIMCAADINRRRYWWKDKKKVATACQALSIEPRIIASTRQTGQKLSVEVLNFALNAVMGAVWLDCQDQNRSIHDSCKTISRILGQIDTILNSSTAAGGDKEASPTGENSALVFSTQSTTQGTPDGNLGSDLDTTEYSANFETYEDFSVFPPQSISEELDDLVVEQSSPQRSIVEQQPFAEYNTVGSVSQNYEQASIPGSLPAETQGVGAQAVFSMEQETILEPITPRAADSSMTVTKRSKRALPDRESEDSVGVQHADSLQRRTKRAQTERDKINAAVESLRDAERQKAGVYAQPERTQLLRYLEYPQTTPPKDSCHLLRFLYMAIGSWDTLADFANQLQIATETRRSHNLPLIFPSTALMAFNMMCRLEDERTTCILLKRYYAIKLVEDGQRSSQLCESIQVETPETFGFVITPQIGNPQVRRGAAEIRFLTSKIIPDAETTSDIYRTTYSKVKRFRQLGKRLQMFTKLFGVGVLALLPSGPSFLSYSLTDNM
jgi:hypothetical protein